MLYGEIKGLTLYDFVNNNHILYFSVFREICPIVSFKETTLTDYVFTIWKIGIGKKGEAIFVMGWPGMHLQSASNTAALDRPCLFPAYMSVSSVSETTCGHTTVASLTYVPFAQEANLHTSCARVSFCRGGNIMLFGTGGQVIIREASLL